MVNASDILEEAPRGFVGDSKGKRHKRLLSKGLSLGDLGRRRWGGGLLTGLRERAWQAGKKCPTFSVGDGVWGLGAQGRARADVRIFAERLRSKPLD